MSDKRQVILNAAQTLLAQYGFHGFSMKQLASEAGIAAGTAYLYFRDKEALIQELHRSVVMTLAEEWLVERDPQLPLQEQFQRYWLKLWDICISSPDRIMCKSQFDSLPPESFKVLAENTRFAFQPLFKLLQQAKEDGLVKSLPDDVLLSLGMEPCLSLARKQYLGLINLDQQQLRESAAAGWDAIAVAN